MVIKVSGIISVNDVKQEFAKSNNDLASYYRGGANVQNHANTANIPTSGTIGLGHFYGQSAYIPGSVAYNSSGSYSWTVPSGVTSLTVKLIGAGGGSAYNGNNSSYGSYGGGGGGYSVATFSVSPGQTCSITIGAGGERGFYDNGNAIINGSTGGTTSFSCPGGSVSANGGGGGYVPNSWAGSGGSGGWGNTAYGSAGSGNYGYGWAGGAVGGAPGWNVNGYNGYGGGHPTNGNNGYLQILYNQVFTSPGSYNFTIPSGVTSISCKVWGAGGGGASPAYGGGGAYVSGTVSVTPGETLIVVVGAGGAAGSYGGSIAGQPGQLCGIFRGSITQGNALFVAGSGGGSWVGPYVVYQSGGAGGHPAGQAGQGTGGGAGGSQSSGGAALTHVASSAYSGGGGAGYWSGYLGSTVVGAYYGPGGGGSSYYISSASSVSVVNGSAYNVAMSGDSDYVSGVGIGSAGAGGNGLIVIQLL